MSRVAPSDLREVDRVLARVDSLINLAGLERAARRRLPRAVFDAIAGGSGDEVTVSANQSAYQEIRLLPRVLEDVAERDMSVQVLGRRVSSPIMIAPTGLQRIAHPDAELAMARAAGKADVLFVVPGFTSYPMEEVAAVSSGPRWFQLYQPAGSTDAADILVDRATAAGFDALCVTVDTAMRGLRERDVHNRFSLPLKFDLKNVVTKPEWSRHLLSGSLGQRPFRRGTNAHFSAPSVVTGLESPARPVTWADLERIRRRWVGPLLVKGLLRADQARRVIDAGADGIVVSNHGGRLLDGGTSTIEVLPEIVQTVRSDAQVFVDGGIRRGTDVVKALGLGATACLVGRPFIYGLAAAGEVGVSRVIELLNAELSRAMGFVGAARVADIDRSFVRLPSERWKAAHESTEGAVYI